MSMVERRVDGWCEVAVVGERVEYAHALQKLAVLEAQRRQQHGDATMFQMFDEIGKRSGASTVEHS